MPFEYVGVQSLTTPGLLDQILISSVEETGLIFDFDSRRGLKALGPVIDYFQQYASLFLASEEGHRALLGTVALAMHSVAMKGVFENNEVFFPESKVIGLHEAAIRKNPNETVALVFGLSLIELQAECSRSPRNYVTSPVRVSLIDITEREVRDAIRLIAENKNRDIRANNGQFRRTFLRLSRLAAKLRARRFKRLSRR